jgi:TatA/E family protein of Tat protein translocase
MPLQGTEILVVAAVVFVLFGAALLPKITRSWTSAIHEAKQTIHESRDAPSRDRKA